MLFNLLVVFFAYLDSYKDFKYGLKISFTLIFIFLALRYNFGNDYKSYYNGYIKVNSYTSINYFNNLFRFEPGWLFLCRVFKSLGFFSLIIFLAFFNSIVYYWFIRRYVPKMYYWLGVFIYVFDPGFMLTHLSAMRQSIAISLFIISIPYIFNRQLIRFVLCILIAYLFHRSAFILLPLYLLGYLNWKINTVTAAIIVSVFISLFLFGKFFLPYLNKLITNNFEKYEVYQGGAAIGTGLGVIYFSAVFILVLYYERFQHKETAVVFKIAIISFLFLPLGLLVQMIGRVGMYLAPSIIIAYPIILKNIKKTIFKAIYITLLLFITTYTFFQFFNSEVFGEAFSKYQTIFSAPTF